MDDGALGSEQLREAPGKRWWLPLLVAIVSFLVYLATLRPEVGPGDSAELALQAYQLGVTHPPGYPLHTFLGKALCLFFSEPATATNLLSSLCAAGAVAVLSAILLHLTGSALAALCAPLIYAFLPEVWEAAVATEVYCLNALMLALALWAVVAWRRRPGWGRLLLTSIIFGLSMGSSAANLLLVPGFLVLLVERPKDRWLGAATFLLVTFLCGVLIMSWSFFRAPQVPPLGTDRPIDSLGNFVYFVTGASYPTAAGASVGFYLQRLVEHGAYWGESFLWLGLAFGVVGVAAQWQRDRYLLGGSLTMLLANFGYFTCYPVVDYRQMVLPSYLVFCVWVGSGLAHLRGRHIRLVPASAQVVVAVLLCLAMFLTELPDQRYKARGTPVTRFVHASFELFPENAYVCSVWPKYAALLYFQKIKGLRPDLTFVELVHLPRRYPWGTVSSFYDFAEEAVAHRPVVVYLDTPPPTDCGFDDLGQCWYQLPPSGWPAACRLAWLDDR
jgi:hypothetical protein